MEKFTLSTSTKFPFTWCLENVIVLIDLIES